MTRVPTACQASGQLQVGFSKAHLRARSLVRGFLTAAFLALLTAKPMTASARPVNDRMPIAVHEKSLPRVQVAGLEIGKGRIQELEGIQDHFATIIAAELRKHGYSTTKDESEEAPLVLLGNVFQFDCSEVNGTTCGIGVDWVLFSRARDAVVYRVRSRHEESSFASLRRDEAARMLLVGVVRSLLSRDKLVAALQVEGRPLLDEELDPATVAACRRDPLSLPGDSEAALDATAVVHAGGAVGSAVFVTPDGYLLTAAHVIGSARSVFIRPRQGDKLRARVVRLDKKRDVALLQVAGRRVDWNCLVVSDMEAKAGEDVYVLGTPAGEEFSFSISRGIVSGRRTIGQFEYLQTDASITAATT